MEKKTWKTIAIIILVLFILENIFWAYCAYGVINENKKTNVCYFEVCSGYPEAYYSDDVCSCYEYDMYGDLILAEEKYMP